MKAYKKPATSKLVAKFDAELKNILANDLKSFLGRNPFLASKRQAMAASTLSVA